MSVLSLKRACAPMALFVAGLLLMTIPGTAQAATTVPLGTAGAYAILAGSGITNTGATTITGDVGSSPTAAETGFAACPGANCVALTGANHTSPNPNDAVTQGAKAALTTAYNNAAGQSPTLVNTELAGQTLAPGVYTSASGTFGMSGTLTLDGQNNANAVFIFQTASTLITGGTGNVVLIRGAQACNVFWKVGSSATLGTGSSLDGTILANTSISLGSGVTVLGRLLAGEQASGSGAVTLIHDTIIRSVCAATPVATPTATPTATATAAKPTTAAASASASAAKVAAAKVAAAKVAAANAATAVTGAATAATPTGAQILRVPVGAVHTGDGSMAKQPAKPRYLGGALALVGVGAVAATVVARRRRHHS